MSLIEDVKYSKDNPEEYNIDLQINLKDNKEIKKIDQARASLLTNSVMVSNELFPTIANSIDQTFKKLQMDNSFVLDLYCIWFINIFYFH